MKRLTLSAIALAASTMIGSAASHADYIGSVWTGQPGAATDATIAQTQGGGLLFGVAPTATFRVNSINFSVLNSDAASVGEFLTSNGVSCTGTACNLGTTLDNSYFLIETAPGFISTNTNNPINTVVVTHDDGVQLEGSVNGLIINAPGPTSPTASSGPWSAPQNITLSYGECCSGPAVLNATLGQRAIPEPASLFILGVALAGFGAMRRRWRRTV